MAARYGAETPVLDWHERLVCSRRGSRRVDIVARVKCARAPYCRPSRPLQWPVGGRKAFSGVIPHAPSWARLNCQAGIELHVFPACHVQLGLGDDCNA